MSTFALLYTEALKALDTPDLSKIKLLRDLARENPGEASNVVAALTQHLLTCPTKNRLPAIYVVDCILKSAGGQYPDLLAGTLEKVFAHVWDLATPDLRSKLARTAGTWGQFLPAAVMAAVTAKMQPPSTAPQQQSLLFSGSGGLNNAPPSTATVLLPGGGATGAQIVYTASGQPVIVAAPLPGTGALGGPGGHAAYGGVLYPSSARPATAGMGQAGVSPALLALGQQLAAAAAAAAPAASGVPSLTIPRPGSNNGASATGDATTAAAAQDPTAAAIDALFAASATTRPKFRDQQFARNRRLAASGHQVRPWFVRVDAWLEGTRAVDDTPALPFGEDPAAEGTGSGSTPALVEEDPSQPTCAISGEAFERTYDPDTDRWYYEDAVVLEGEQALAFGVMPGSIVKVHCLAGGPDAPPAPRAQPPAAAVPSDPRSGARQLQQQKPGVAQQTGVQASASHSVDGGPQSGEKRRRADGEEPAGDVTGNGASVNGVGLGDDGLQLHAVPAAASVVKAGEAHVAALAEAAPLQPLVKRVKVE